MYRVIEHADITKKADEEREKRPDYKPIIDHDGLPRQWSSNQVYRSSSKQIPIGFRKNRQRAMAPSFKIWFIHYSCLPYHNDVPV